MTPEEAILEFRRRDFYRFVQQTFPNFTDGWVYEDLCSRLKQFMQDVREQKAPRLIVNLPPRMGKSQITTVRFALFCLLNNPSWEVIVGSYGQSLSNKFSKFARGLLQGHPYVRTLWPHVKLAGAHAAVEEWRVVADNVQSFTGGGTYRAVGRGSAITGSGAHCLILDDTLKDFAEADSEDIREGLWDWYTSTARTRLSPGGGIVIVQTRWHPDDLIGRLEAHQRNDPKADQWVKIEYRAIAEEDEPNRKMGESLLPDRWSAEEFERTMRSMAPRWWSALYQQNPVARGGNLFKGVHFNRYLAAPDLDSFEQLIQVWDLRFGKSQKKTSSYVVGWLMGRIGSCFYVLAEERGRWSYAESRDAIRRMTDTYPQAITKVIENKANGEAIQSDLETEIIGMVAYNPRGDKYQRAEHILPVAIAGNIYMPDDEICSWASGAMGELEAFPRGADDDRVDCLTMGISYMLEQQNMICEVYAL